MGKTKSTLIFIITILYIVVFTGYSFMKISNNSIGITKPFYLSTLKTTVSDKKITRTKSKQIFEEVLKNGDYFEM